MNPVKRAVEIRETKEALKEAKFLGGLVEMCERYGGGLQAVAERIVDRRIRDEQSATSQ